MLFLHDGVCNITSGSIYNGRPTINTLALNNQGFMPVLTGVGPHRDSGHWIMLIKGPVTNTISLTHWVKLRVKAIKIF